MSDGLTTTPGVPVYDRHDRPTGHRLLADGAEFTRVLGHDLRSAVLEAAGRVSVAAANRLVDGAIHLGTIGRSLQIAAAALAPPPVTDWESRSPEYQAALRAEAMRRHPSFRSQAS